MTRRSILLVEDDHAVREIVALVLGDTYDVKHAASGAEALAILQRDPVGAVVLDYRLPDRTGLEVLTEIKAARPGLPVIMITGYGSEWVCASAFKLGARDYFSKPVNVFELLNSVDRILWGAPARREGCEPLGHRRQPFPPGLSLQQSDARIQKVVTLIQQRYWDSLSLSELACEAGMGKYRLSRRFREVMGVTLRAYMLTVRLERAKELLCVGRASITEVAQAAGFGDLPRFDKVFKRGIGLTPSAYRSRALLRSNDH